MERGDYNYHGPVVVFDLDDTLFRERDFCRSGFKVIENILVKIFGNKMRSISLRMDSYLRRRENYFDLLEEILGQEGALGMMNDLVAQYRYHLPEKLHLTDGMQGVLDHLRDKGTVIAIVTDGRTATQRNKIKALGLDQYVARDNVYISAERGVDKSKPDSFIDIVRKYPEAKKFIYVADNERKDFSMPNLLGWTTCRVPYHFDNVHPDFLNDDIRSQPEVRMMAINDILSFCS